MNIFEKIFRKPAPAQEAPSEKPGLNPEEAQELSTIREEVRQGMPEIPADASAGKILEMYHDAVAAFPDNAQHMSTEEEEALTRLAAKE